MTVTVAGQGARECLEPQVSLCHPHPGRVSLAACSRGVVGAGMPASRITRGAGRARVPSAAGATVSPSSRKSLACRMQSGGGGGEGMPARSRKCATCIQSGALEYLQACFFPAYIHTTCPLFSFALSSAAKEVAAKRPSCSTARALTQGATLTIRS